MSRRICIDCKHHVRGQIICCSKEPDMVTGKPAPATSVRADASKCGPEAQWYEPMSADDWREPRDAEGYRKPLSDS